MSSVCVCPGADKATVALTWLYREDNEKLIWHELATKYAETDTINSLTSACATLGTA